MSHQNIKTVIKTFIFLDMVFILVFMSKTLRDRNKNTDFHFFKGALKMFVKVRDGADISDGKVSEFESFCLNTRHKHINHSKPLVFSAHKNNSSSSSRFSNA